MKNSITITIDADNLEPIRFSKKEYENKFPNTEEAKEIIMTDLLHLTCALVKLIHIADSKNCENKETIKKLVIDKINSELN